MPEKKYKKILIAEDDRPIAKALQLKLEHSGFKVSVVSNGEEAIEAVGKDNFDLVLLDLMMPKKDGFTFLEELKSKKNRPAVIVLSNLSQSGDMEKAQSLGASAYFVKSDTPLVNLVSHIQKILKP